MIIKDKNGIEMSVNPRFYVKATPVKTGGCIIQLGIESMEGSIQSCQSVREIDAIMQGWSTGEITPSVPCECAPKNKGGRPRKEVNG